MRRPLIGLDIDSSSVRMVRLRRKNDQYTVVAAAVNDITPSGNDRGLQRAKTIEAIRNCFEALGPGRKWAVCGLRGAEVVVRGFEFPSLPREETRGAVELESSQMCPFSMDDGALDHQVTSDRDNKTRGYWVAANHTLIEDKKRLVREAGLQCVLMDVDGLALLNCLENLPVPASRGVRIDYDRPDDARPVVLDIGDSHASIAIIDQAHRPFVRDVCSGGREILWQVAREMQIPSEEARDALLGEGSYDATLFQPSLERACGPLLEEIVTTMRYYAAQNRSIRVNKMLVCGSFASARGFIELLATRLSIEVVPWNPVGDMDHDIDPAGAAVLEKAGPALTVAAGLAMRTI